MLPATDSHTHTYSVSLIESQNNQCLLNCPPADPLQSVLQTLEKQHQEEKRCALERQRQMYEQELQQLRQRVTPEKPSGVPGSATAAVLSAGSNKRVRRWSEDRWRCSLCRIGPQRRNPGASAQRG